MSVAVHSDLPCTNGLLQGSSSVPTVDTSVSASGRSIVQVRCCSRNSLSYALLRLAPVVPCVSSTKGFVYPSGCHNFLVAFVQATCSRIRFLHSHIDPNANIVAHSIYRW